MIASIVILLLYAVALGISLAKHGEEKKGKHNFWSDLVTVILLLYLLYLAGTFDKLINL